MEVMILDMPFVIGKKIAETAPIWVASDLPNTVVRLYSTDVTDEDSGEEKRGFSVSLQAFGHVAWYASVIWIEDDGTAITLMPTDFDPIPYFTSMAALGLTPLSVTLSMQRNATAPLLENFDTDPIIKLAHTFWLLQQASLIEEAMKEVSTTHYSDPFSRFVNEELDELDD